jgi:hypothetical protein
VGHLLWLAFALVYLPSVGSLGYSGREVPGQRLVAALYLSGTVLTTLAWVTWPRRPTAAHGRRAAVGAGWRCSPPRSGYLPAIYTVVSDLRTSAEAVSDLEVTTPERAVELLSDNAVLTLESVRPRRHQRAAAPAALPGAALFTRRAGSRCTSWWRARRCSGVAARLGFSADRAPVRCKRHAQALELALRRLVDDAQGHVGGQADDAGRERAHELVREAREAVQGTDAQHAEDEPDAEAIDDLARAHAVMRRYAHVHGYPCPTAF